MSKAERLLKVIDNMKQISNSERMLKIGVLADRLVELEFKMDHSLIHFIKDSDFVDKILVVVFYVNDFAIMNYYGKILGTVKYTSPTFYEDAISIVEALIK